MENKPPNITPVALDYEESRGPSPSSIPSPPSPPNFVAAYHNDKSNNEVKERMSKLEKIIELMYLQNERVKQDNQSIRQETETLKSNDEKKKRISKDLQKRMSKLEKIVELMYNDCVRIKSDNNILKQENESIQKDLQWMKETILSYSTSPTENTTGTTNSNTEERVTYPFVLNNKNGKYENSQENLENEISSEEKRKQTHAEIFIPSLSGEESTITMMEDTVTMDTMDGDEDDESKKLEKEIILEVESSKKSSKDGDLESPKMIKENRISDFGNLIRQISEKMDITKPLLYNTKTIHMFALSIHYDCAIHPTKWKRISSYSLSIYSLLILFFQILVFYSLFFASSFPTCTTHTDCSLGAMCNGFDSDRFRQPRCSACATMIREWDDMDINTGEKKGESFSERKNCSNLLNNRMVEWNPWEKVDQSIIWYESDFTPNFEYAFLSGDTSMATLENSTAMPTSMTQSIEDEEIIMKCLAIRHCQEEKLSSSSVIGIESNPTFSNRFDIKNTCPHLTAIMAKVSTDQIAVFLFLALIFASIISHNMREAAIENILLDHAVHSFHHNGEYQEIDNDPNNDDGNQQQVSSSKFKFNNIGMPLSAFLLRISNRIRIYILPWYAGAAVCSINLSEDLSSKTMVLNLIAVVFVIEADNLLASLFLTKKQTDLATDLIIATKENYHGKDPVEQGTGGERLRKHGHFDTSAVSYSEWTRILGLIVALVLISATMNMQSLLESLHDNERGCDGITFVVGLLFMGLFPGLVILIQALWTVVFGRDIIDNTDPHDNDTVHAGCCSNVDDDMLLQPSTKRKLFFGMLEFFRNYISFALCWWFLNLSASFVTPEANSFYPPFQIWLSILSTLYAVIRLSLIVNDFGIDKASDNDSTGNDNAVMNISISSSQQGQSSLTEQESKNGSKLSSFKVTIPSQETLEEYWEKLKDNTFFNVVMLFFWIAIQLWAMVSLITM